MLPSSHKPLNEINILTVDARYVRDQLNVMQGTVTLGNNGLEFERQFKNGYVQVPYDQIDKVQVQIAFGRFYRGFYLITKDGKKMNIMTSKTKQVIHVFNRKLASDQIERYRRNQEAKRK